MSLEICSAFSFLVFLWTIFHTKICRSKKLRILIEFGIEVILFLVCFSRMESAYRTWVKERRERPSPENLDELCRELQTALGTAKWQVQLVLFYKCLSVVTVFQVLILTN